CEQAKSGPAQQPDRFRRREHAVNREGYQRATGDYGIGGRNAGATGHPRGGSRKGFRFMSEEALHETRVPDWYPEWASRLSHLYFSRTTSMFVLHGNVQDLIRTGGDQPSSYGTLADFLAAQIFGRW